ncbi:MAG TPA: nuclear transport factor 2 family protein [Prosthecobacter sp.]
MSTTHPHPPGPVHNDDEAQIRAEIQSWTDAIRRKDVEAALPHFAHQAVRFFLAPPLETEAPLRENLESWFRTFQGEICYELRQLTVTAAGGIGFSHSINRITGTKTDGQQANLWFRETLCFQKIDNRWRIIHAHDSVPFYLDGTHRAAVDLQPTSLG